ncbi:MAG: metallophosphoesterase [Christensenellales bacterium]
MRADSDIIWRSFGMVPEICIYPLADVHLGSEESAMPAFGRLIAQIASEPNSYVTLQGDLIDNGLKNSVTNIYRATMSPREQKREMAEALTPIRSKVLAILPGNHERRSSRESDDCPAYDIASKLDLEEIYRENMAVIRVGLGRRPNNSKEYTYNIACLHGAGGGTQAGATVNRYEAFLSGLDGVDILIAAHAHKPYCLRSSKLVLDLNNHRVLQRPTLSMCAGSWLNYAGYPVTAMMRPVAEPGANKLVLHGMKYRFEAVI